MSTGLCAVCQRPALLRCARCHSVNYCGKEHQKKHWTKHQKTNCLAYKVRSFDDERYVVATRDIRKGEIILTETPLALGPQDDACPGCFRPLPKNNIYIRCPRCKWPVCSRMCPGLTDPLFHGAECQILSAIKSSFFVHCWKALLPLRCLLLQKNDPKKWQVSYELARKADDMTNKTSKGEGYYFLEQAILKPLSAKAPHLLPPNCSAPVLQRIFSLVNALGVFLRPPHREGVVALLPVTSLMDHSCLPNTRLALEGPSELGDGSERRGRIVVRAAEDIEKGDELTSFFIDIFQPTVSRQKILEECRSSECFCERCSDPTELGTNLGTVICEICSGSVVPIETCDILETDWECRGTCGKTFTSDEAFNKQGCFTDIDVSHFSGRLQFLESVKAKVEKTLHPHNINFLRLKILFIELCTDRIEHDIILVSELKEGADYCRDVLNILLNSCLIDATYSFVADILSNLSQINLEIMKRRVASKELDSTGAELAKKYCAELKLLSARFGNAEYKESDIQSLRGNDIRLWPF